VIVQLKASVDLMQLQVTVANRIAAAASAGSSDGSSSRGAQQPAAAAASITIPEGITPARMAADVRALRSRCMDLDTLYNTYAQPYAQWDMCLSMCNVASTVPGEYVRNLWDLLLKQVSGEGFRGFKWHFLVLVPFT
jgi:hypothetical protein